MMALSITILFINATSIMTLSIMIIYISIECHYEVNMLNVTYFYCDAKCLMAIIINNSIRAKASFEDWLP